MGIHDRDYVRRGSDPAGPAAAAAGNRFLTWIRSWSVNAWLIGLCVAVFVTDQLLGTSWVLLTTTWGIEEPHRLDRSALMHDQIKVIARDWLDRPAQGTRVVYVATSPLGPDGAPSGVTVPVPVGREHLVRMGLLERHLFFSTRLGFQRAEVWRLVGFQFLHANTAHLLLNMVGLFFFGPMVEAVLGRKRYLAFYIMCGIFGAALYVLLNLGGVLVQGQVGADVRVPGLIFSDPGQPLIGASAAVFGVLIAGAYHAPDTDVFALFLIPMKLATLAYLLVGLAFLTVFFHAYNAAGEAAHLGGAIAGFYFIRHPRQLHGFFDFLGRADPTSHHYRPGAGRKGRPPERVREVDRILDKISAEGISSLTDDERRLLHEHTADPGAPDA